jgi:hypothetical protein
VEAPADFKQRQERLQPRVLPEEAIFLQSLFHPFDQLPVGERLQQETLRSQMHPLDGVVHRPLAGNDDGGKVMADLFGPSQQVEPVHPRHVDVGEQQVERLRFQALQRLAGLCDGRGIVSLSGEDLRAQVTNHHLIVHDEDPFSHPRGACFPSAHLPFLTASSCVQHVLCRSTS